MKSFMKLVLLALLSFVVQSASADPSFDLRYCQKTNSVAYELGFIFGGPFLVGHSEGVDFSRFVFDGHGKSPQIPHYTQYLLDAQDGPVVCPIRAVNIWQRSNPDGSSVVYRFTATFPQSTKCKTNGPISTIFGSKTRSFVADRGHEVDERFVCPNQIPN